VVEDDLGIREMLAALLRAEHYDVVTAGDGEEALERIYEQAPDLVITDVMMPRLSGFDLCRKLRAHRATRDIPVIVLTTKSEVESEVEGLEIGADDYIPKPIEPRRLLARMRRVLLHAGLREG
jgi:DNA-binding response OmpR family regulator